MIRVEWPPGPGDGEGRATPDPANVEKVFTRHLNTNKPNPISAPPGQHSGDTVAGPPNTDHLVGVFPQCDGCGARVAHYSVRSCFHCQLNAQAVPE